ncbi:MAG: hypothetical protein KGL39_59155, partial [Patescibacteria group bacterium]|nr:hypothetical protein [Patescibacteria group bacterium]
MTIIKTGVIALIATTCVGVIGCRGGASSPQIDPRALARATVETAESAWLATAKACVADAVSTDSQATLQKCEAMLDPARETLVAAAYSVDTWTAADQKNFPCMIGSAMKAIQASVMFLQSEQVAV